MVDLCPVVKWSSIQMVVWKRTEKSLFMVQNVQYLNVSPSHVTFPFEYRTPRLSVFKCSVFRWLLYLQPPELFRLWFPAVRTWPCLPRRWCRTSWPTHNLLLRHSRLQLPVGKSGIQLWELCESGVANTFEVQKTIWQSCIVWRWSLKCSGLFAETVWTK